MEEEYIVWHDNDYDFALWVIENSDLKEKEVLIKSIPKTNNAKLLLKKLNKEDYGILPIIKLATPDLIIERRNSNNSKIVFASEFMTHTPQHDHVFQRFERIYCISKEKIPVAFVLPSVKTKLEKGTREGYREVKYRPNPLAIHTYLKTTNINKNPTLMFFWPEKDGYLKYDSKHPTAPKINKEIQQWFDFLNLSLKEIDPLKMINYKAIKEQIRKMEIKSKIGKFNFNETKFEDYLLKIKELYNLERVEIVDTKNAIKNLKLDKEKLSKEFLSRNRSLLFSYNSKKFRTDPYGGFVCGFTNLFCINEDNKKELNFIQIPKGIYFKEISKIKRGENPCFKDLSDESSNCPLFSLKNFDANKIESHLNSCVYSKSKQQRIFGTIPDVIIFEDKIYYNKNG